MILHQFVHDVSDKKKRDDTLKSKIIVGLTIKEKLQVIDLVLIKHNLSIMS